ncbi:hypothetical protein [Cryobacterium sp. AP23]
MRDELAEQTERIAAEDRVIAQAQARRIELLLELQDWSEDPRVSSRLHGDRESIATADRNAATMTDDQARAAAYARWDEHKIARRTIVTETACLTRTAERTIEHQLDEARFLYSYAPLTFDALSKGEISYRHATALLDQIRAIPDAEQAAFEEAVLPVAKSQPVGRFKDRARRLRERRHPESIVTRSKDALTERRTFWEPAHDGMGWLHWYGTAEQTKAAWDRITSTATGLKKLGDPAPASDSVDSGTRTATPSGASTGDGAERTGASFGIEQAVTDEAPARTLDQLRADVTAALLLDGITPSGMGAGIRGTVMITVPVMTLLGLDEEPATLEGYGPISPEAARRITANAPSFTRVLTHPESGVILSIDKKQQKITKGMRKVLRMRDETCRFPGCSRPAVKSDIDHTQDRQYDGGTDLDNLAHLCEGHHRLKHLSQWSVIQEPGGVLVWTSPGNRTYRTDPANPIAPPRPKLPTVGPKNRKRPADDMYLMPRHQPKRHPSAPVPENPPF